jgi:hypothetical protein
MSVEDLERLALTEVRIRENQDINRISDLPDSPFSSLDEARAAKASGAITFGAPYQPRLVEAWGTRGEVFAHYFWLTLATADSYCLHCRGIHHRALCALV